MRRPTILLTSDIPLRLRAVRSRNKGSQPAPSSAGGDLQADNYPMAIGADPGRHEGVHVDHSAPLPHLQDHGVGGDEGVRPEPPPPGDAMVAEWCSLECGPDDQQRSGRKGAGHGTGSRCTPGPPARRAASPRARSASIVLPAPGGPVRNRGCSGRGDLDRRRPMTRRPRRRGRDPRRGRQRATRARRQRPGSGQVGDQSPGCLQAAPPRSSTNSASSVLAAGTTIVRCPAKHHGGMPLTARTSRPAPARQSAGAPPTPAGPRRRSAARPTASARSK